MVEFGTLEYELGGAVGTRAGDCFAGVGSDFVGDVDGDGDAGDEVCVRIGVWELGHFSPVVAVMVARGVISIAAIASASFETAVGDHVDSW
jgi:hypothetical protein